MDAVTAVFAHDSSTSSFDAVYTAARSLEAPQQLSDLNSKLRQAFSHRLSSVDLTSLPEIVRFWKTFESEVKQIEAFWKWVGIRSLESRQGSTSIPKYAQLRSAHFHRCTAIAVDVWTSAVHARVQRIVAAEFDAILATAMRHGGKLDASQQELFDYLRLMGQDCVAPAIRLVRSEFESQFASLSDSEKVDRLITGTNLVATLFPVEDLHEQTVLPYLEPLVSSLLTARDFPSLARLARFVDSSLSVTYSDIIVRHFAGVSIPDDFFGMCAILADYSAILLNDSPVKRAVANKILNREFQFPQKLVVLLFANAEFPQKLRPLASLVGLYDDMDAISTELLRGFLLRMLQKRRTSIEKEEQFCDALMPILSIEHLRSVRSLLRDYTAYGNFIIVNTTLSMPLLWNDAVDFPEDLARPALIELDAYARPFANRRFRLSGTFSSACVRALWGGNEERHLVVSVLQYRLLQMMGAGKTDFGNTGATVDALTSAVRCLLKGGIIARNGRGYEIAANPPKDKRINLYNGAIDFRNVGRAAATKEERDHTLGIQSVAAREMKSARRMLEGELENRVIVGLSAKFRVTPGEFQGVLKHMLESEFVERDERDTRYLVYVP
jgi:hypothetical protein